MMVKDNRGQVSFEYLMIFTISLILLVVFTLPLTENSIENTLDISDSLDVKSDLSNVAQGIKHVYGEGQGSKQSINIHSSKPFTINVASNYVSSNINLKSGSSKVIKVTFKSNLVKTDIPITKGDNTLIVEWPLDSKNMVIYKK